MMLFPTRRPRRFKYTPRYGRKYDFAYHDSLNKRKGRRTLVLIVLLVLLLALVML